MKTLVYNFILFTEIVTFYFPLIKQIEIIANKLDVYI